VPLVVVIETATAAVWPFAPVTASAQIAGITGVTENVAAPVCAIAIAPAHVPPAAVNGPLEFGCETVNGCAAAAPVARKTSFAGATTTGPGSGGGGGAPVLPPPPHPETTSAQAHAETAKLERGGSKRIMKTTFPTIGASRNAWDAVFGRRVRLSSGGSSADE
jgi:hypothetical protein